MSLKFFHILFIALSTVVVAIFGAWAFGQYSASGSTAYLLVALAALAAAGGLVAYGRAFLRKMRRAGLMALAMALAAPRDVLACPVCFGASDSPMAHGMRYGVMALLGVTTLVLVGFAAFFLLVMRRIKAAEAAESRIAGSTLPIQPAPQRAS